MSFIYLLSLTTNISQFYALVSYLIFIDLLSTFGGYKVLVGMHTVFTIIKNFCDILYFIIVQFYS